MKVCIHPGPLVGVEQCAMSRTAPSAMRLCRGWYRIFSPYRNRASKFTNKNKVTKFTNLQIKMQNIQKKRSVLTCSLSISVCSSCFLAVLSLRDGQCNRICSAMASGCLHSGHSGVASFPILCDMCGVCATELISLAKNLLTLVWVPLLL
jgi:hypothetical protein